MHRFGAFYPWPVMVAGLLLFAVHPALASVTQSLVCNPALASLGTATTLSSGVYHYSFTLTNASVCASDDFNWPVIVDFELPLLSPDSISNISSPGSWAYQILSSADFEKTLGIDNPFGSPYVLHWYDIPPQDSPAWQEGIVPLGFSNHYSFNNYTVNVYENSASFAFDSLMSPENGPYESSWLTSGRQPGDPPLPGAPVEGVGAGLPPFSPSAIPEPSGLLLLASVLVAFGLVTIQRRSKA